MVDIFDEVSGDLRAERAEKLLRRYGALLLLAAILVLAAVGGQQLWQNHQGRQNDAAATKYLAITGQITSAAPAQQLADATQLTDFAATAPAGYRTLARLRAAGIYANAGQTGQAEALWNAVSADTDADILLRQLADLLWAQHALGTAPDIEVAQRLQPLTDTENTWHGLARETQALLYLHEGKTDQAKALFNEISSDPSAPEGVRNRAEGLLAQLQG